MESLLARFSDVDRAVIFQCLRAVAFGPFFSDYEFPLLMGMQREEVRQIADRAPDIDDRDPMVRRAIGMSLLNLSHFSQEPEEWRAWPAYISVSREIVARVQSDWSALLPPLVYSKLEVHGPVKIANRFYRVIEYTIEGRSDDRNTGYASQVWDGTEWGANTDSDGPGCMAILATEPAAEAELFDSQVDVAPLPADYDPIC